MKKLFLIALLLSALPGVSSADTTFDFSFSQSAALCGNFGITCTDINGSGTFTALLTMNDGVSSPHCGGLGVSYYQIEGMIGEVNGSPITSFTSTAGTCLGAIILVNGVFRFPPLDYFGFMTGGERWQFFTGDMNPFVGITILDALDNSGAIIGETPLDLTITQATPTPEPDALLLTLMGFLGIGFWKKCIISKKSNR